MKSKEFFRKPESESKEDELEIKIKSQILLHFTRHGEKTKVPGKTNKEQELTLRGKDQAIRKGKGEALAAKASLAYGSNILRAQQAAGFEMAGAMNGTDIIGDENLEELKRKLDIINDKKLYYGTRLGEDKRLGFSSHNKQFEEASNEAYNKGEGLKWMVEESDKLARELNDEKSTTYLRAAGNIAEVVDKYTKVVKNFTRIIDDPDKKERYGQKLERFLGSHSGVIDLFLARLVEKVKGIKERDKLIAALGNQGFDFAEGFDIEIDDVVNKDKPRVKIRYEKKDEEDKIIFRFDEEISKEVIDEMINEK